MADAVASPNPSNAAAQPAPDASRARPADPGKLRVFISYSRVDRDFADQLLAALDACGFDCVIDREDISGGEDWKQRLGALIAEADTVVFILSPASAESAVCAWEVGRSAELGKRLIPVVPKALGAVVVPPRLQSLNYVFLYADPDSPGSGFGQGLRLLAQALNTDFDWLREHTRYLERASEWDQGGRPASRLLTGGDIAAAKAWAANRPRTAPPPTTLQLDFFHASEAEEQARANAELQRLRALKDATDEREAALREKEAAVERAQEEQRRRARTAIVRNVLFITSLLGAVAAVVVSFSAVTERKNAESLLGKAKPIVAAAQNKMDQRTRNQAFAFFTTAAESFKNAAARGYVGVSYRNGWNPEGRDYPKAIENLEQAAKADDRNAMDNLGAIYDSGEAADAGYPADPVKARNWYERAGDGPRGLTAAVVNRARLYDEGRGFPADPALALTIYKEAAKPTPPGEPSESAAQDDEPARASAMFAIGELYREGRGAPANMAEARSWYDEAQKAGHSGAKVRLAEMDEAGLGAPDSEANRLLREAVQQKNRDAMFRLGDLIWRGYGRTEDVAQAIYWRTRAASAGSRDAMRALAALYEDGATVARDPARAAAWRAAAEGRSDPPIEAWKKE